MRDLLAGLVSLAMLGTGCVGVVRVPGQGHGQGQRAAVKSEKRCPPGHQWSDGQCHSRGKGHDPGRKAK